MCEYTDGFFDYVNVHGFKEGKTTPAPKLVNDGQLLHIMPNAVGWPAARIGTAAWYTRAGGSSLEVTEYRWQHCLLMRCAPIREGGVPSWDWALPADPICRVPKRHQDIFIAKVLRTVGSAGSVHSPAGATSL